MKGNLGTTSTASHNTRYQQDVAERDAMISDLKDKAKALSQQNTNAEVEIESLRERCRQEVDTVVRLKSTVSSAEAVRMELVERLSANARLDSRREQSMYMFVDELRQSVDGFRASERESESQQQRVFFEKVQELTAVEQKVAEKAALISPAEHNLNEECVRLCKSRRDSDSTLRTEVEKMSHERDRLRIEFMTATKDAGAMNRQLMDKDKDDEVRPRSKQCAFGKFVAAREFS